MNTQLTLREIRNALGSFIEIGKKDGLSFDFNYRVAKICKVIEPIVKTYEESLTKFLEENGTYSKESGGKRLDTSNEKLMLSFNEANKNLLNEYFEFYIEKIPLKMFSDYDIPAANIRAILWAIRE